MEVVSFAAGAWLDSLAAAAPAFASGLASVDGLSFPRSFGERAEAPISPRARPRWRPIRARGRREGAASAGGVSVAALDEDVTEATAGAGAAGAGFAARITGGAVAPLLLFFGGLGARAGGWDAVPAFASGPFFAVAAAFCAASAAFFLAFLLSGAEVSPGFDEWVDMAGGGGAGGFFLSSLRLGLVAIAATFAWSL